MRPAHGEWALKLKLISTPNLPQQLAALLIARQVIGNLKESALPYVLEQLRLAKLSFDMFGALSPSDAKKPLPGDAGVGSTADPEDKGTPDKPSVDRNISQAELESSLFKVGLLAVRK